MSWRRRSVVQPHMADSLKDHTLVKIVDIPGVVTIFRLKDPQYSRLMGCLIIFTEEGIVIQGDLVPGENGVISTYGYGLNWFAEEKSDSYLCEKFLKKTFVREYAVDAFRERVLRWRHSGDLDRDKAREAWEWMRLNEDELNGFNFYEAYYEYFGDSPDGAGMGYDPGDAGWLCLIHSKFVELYSQLQKEVAA